MLKRSIYINRILSPTVIGVMALAFELLEASEPKVNDLSADWRWRTVRSSLLTQTLPVWSA